MEKSRRWGKKLDEKRGEERGRVKKMRGKERRTETRGVGMDRRRRKVEGKKEVHLSKL